MKKNRITLLIIVLAILLMMFTIYECLFGLFNQNTEGPSDEKTAQRIKEAIVVYIVDTGDEKMLFGGNQDATVDSILLNLQRVTNINGKEYGPYLESKGARVSEKSYYPMWTPEVGGKYGGWEIIIEIGDRVPNVEVKGNSKNTLVLK